MCAVGGVAPSAIFPLFVELSIMIVPASKSKVAEAKSIPVPLNFIWPPLPTTENNGVVPLATPKNTPTSP